MKNFFTSILIIIFCFNLFSIKTSFSNLDEANINKIELNKSIKWKQYVKAIDYFIEKNKNNEKKLKEINFRLNNLISAWNLKNDNLWNIIKYLNSKVNNAISDIENSKVNKWDKVYVHYIGKFINGEKFDSSYELWEPLSFIVGDWSMISGFDEAIVDMKIGEKKYITLQPNQAYWEKDNKNNVVIAKSDLQEFKNAWYKLEAWEILPTNIWDLTILFNDETTVTLDWNHPMAWKILKFEIELIDIESSNKSSKWYKIIEKTIIENIKNNSFINSNSNAKISLIIYSDLECPYCAKLHNDWTTKKLEEKYWNDLNIIYNHYPLSFHNNAIIAAEILECSANQKWSEAFYKLIEISFEKLNSNKEFLINESVKLWVNKDELNKCIENSLFEEKINTQMQKWENIFWITGTPWIVIINNETLEYEILWWAYPVDNFIEIIENIK